MCVHLYYIIGTGQAAKARRSLIRPPACLHMCVHIYIVAIFYPFSQFCEIGVSLPSL